MQKRYSYFIVHKYKYNFTVAQTHSFVYILSHIGEDIVNTIMKQKIPSQAPTTSVSVIASAVCGLQKSLINYLWHE